MEQGDSYSNGSNGSNGSNKDYIPQYDPMYEMLCDPAAEVTVRADQHAEESWDLVVVGQSRSWKCGEKVEVGVGKGEVEG